MIHFSKDTLKKVILVLTLIKRLISVYQSVQIHPVHKEKVFKQ